MGTPTKGSSAVVGPDGRILSASDTRGEELIIADLDMSQIIKTKTFADASGHCIVITCLIVPGTANFGNRLTSGHVMARS